MIRRMSPSLTTVQVTAVRSRERRGEEKRGAERRGDSPSLRKRGGGAAQGRRIMTVSIRGLYHRSPCLGGGGEESLQRSEERRVSKSKN